MPGDNSVGLVNPESMIHDLVSNFFGNQYEDIVPFTVIASQREKKVMGLYIRSDNEISFVFLRAGEGLVRKPQEQVLGNGNFFN